MYPMLFRESGITYSELIDRLISLAIERGKKERLLKTDYTGR
jgi:D-alanine-D-alanine ligase